MTDTTLLSAEAREKGVYLGGIRDSTASEFLGKLIEPDSKSEQSLLFVPKGFQSAEAINLHPKNPRTHLLVVVEDGASVQVNESLDERCAYHAVEVFLGEGASLDFLSTQNSLGSRIEIAQRSRIEKDARMHWRNIANGCKGIAHDLVSEVVGEGGESSVDWIFYAKGKDKHSLSATNVFNSSHGSGKITIKGVAEGKSHVQCNGMINIGEGGSGTDTYLTEDILMLDATAKVDAVPGLEIKTNDVKASHSATVSKVSEEDIFYFASRGIAKEEARRMYIEGFLDLLIS